MHTRKNAKNWASLCEVYSKTNSLIVLEKYDDALKYSDSMNAKKIPEENQLKLKISEDYLRNVEKESGYI